MKIVKLFVEGGGDEVSLHIDCRSGFNAFLKKAGLDGHMPRIIPCGSRNRAYEQYAKAVKNGENAVLLVDSESPVLAPKGDPSYDGTDIKTWNPWYHFANRKGKDGKKADNWDKPQGVANSDCHLMVEMMESWFFADIDALEKYYGQGFNSKAMGKNESIEDVPKDVLMDRLKKATQKTNKGAYDKGDHSFKILKNIDAQKVASKSMWAGRFLTLLTEKMYEGE